MRRTALKRRRGLRPVSGRRVGDAPDRAAVWASVQVRDRCCMVLFVADACGRRISRCFGPLTPHHRRKASQGGAYSEANIVAACAHHNDALEADAKLAAWARSVGLVVRRGDAGWEDLGWEDLGG